jgi:transcriptional regulator GlxA family with amidase domain
MQAKDFFHMAGLRFGKQEGLGLTPLVQIRLVSPDGKPVTAFSGDVLPVDGTWTSRSGDHPGLLGRLRQPHLAPSPGRPWLRSAMRGRVSAAKATGVFWLAEAGLLDGKEATTYWRFFDQFATRFPRSH